MTTVVVDGYAGSCERTNWVSLLSSDDRRSSGEAKHPFVAPGSRVGQDTAALTVSSYGP